MAGRAPRWEKVLFVAVLLGVAVLLVGVRLASRGPEPAAPSPADPAPLLQPYPVTLGPGTHLLGGLAPAAAYVVETSRGLVLVDAGLEAAADTAVRQMAELGLDPTDLRAILLTHGHADHSLGAEQLRRRTGAKVYAGKGDCPSLRRGGPREAFFSTFHTPYLEPHPTTVDVELTGGEVLAFGDTRFEVIATPGHTPGSLCYRMERPGLRALFTGDVVQSLADTAASKPLGTYTAYLPPRYRGDAQAFRASLRKLRELPVPDLILPGHPQADPAPQNAHLAPGRWHALLDQGIREMDQLLARYDADGADFLDGDPKELLPGLHYLGDHGGAAVYCLEAAGKLYLFDAPGGPGFVPFLEKRFRERKWEGRKPAAVLLTSCDAAATSGLAALVKQSGCVVVASKAGRDAIQKLCPEGTKFLSEEDLAKTGWFDVRAIPLEGRGVAPIAFLLRWAGKVVLVSGRIPVKGHPAEVERLLADLAKPGGGTIAYGRSVQRLTAVEPDLWLPAVPLHGQNANLYDREWRDILAINRRLFP